MTDFDPRLRINAPVEWRAAPGLTDYEAAVAFMEARAGEIRAGTAGELMWLVEHPPLYTGGTSAKEQDLIAPDRFPVYKTARGGQYTYHGPGQRVVYAMLDLEKRGKDVRAFVHGLEAWLIEALALMGVEAGARADRVGVWVARETAISPLVEAPAREDKIAAIGVRVRRWVSFHGIALNVRPDLTHFAGITPCGIADPNYGVTSLDDLGKPYSMAETDQFLRRAFETIFGPTADSAPGRVDANIKAS